MQTAYKIVFDYLTTLTFTTGLTGWTIVTQAAEPLNTSGIGRSQFNSSSIKANRGSGRVNPWVSVELAELEDDRGSGRFIFKPLPLSNLQLLPLGEPVSYRGTGR
ncbi:MAG: hypothetical protein HC886_04240 [Leptolyngbyaceae cyanobacterium SM1_1_3]|nr:hypothetical protein [Leptolyngbyaceae cyanobacterium SM1_1_3]NJN03032.1 hypothetical protein [Leptolyngbyaceae cyanobacterium RM1_1_2]NJO08386.1 hypothetical protein [Leptolyngbyaceae cyanobacterium SL_1_1]